MTGGVSYRDHIFRNAGTRYEDVTPDNVRALQADHGVQWADFDGDGDEDLALTGSRPDGMHSLLRNLLPAASARQSLQVRVVDGRGRATLAGAEVRVYQPGTRTLLGARLVDSGSGYDAQNEMPVHFGLSGQSRVDVEVIYPSRQSAKGGTSCWREDFRGPFRGADHSGGPVECQNQRSSLAKIKSSRRDRRGQGSQRLEIIRDSRRNRLPGAARQEESRVIANQSAAVIMWRSDLRSLATPPAACAAAGFARFLTN